MKHGRLKIIFLLFIFFFANTTILFTEDQIQSVPLINLDELSPTFEEDKDELDKNDENNISSNLDENILKDSNLTKNDEIYINLKALDKITAKTSSLGLP